MQIAQMLKNLRRYSCNIHERTLTFLQLWKGKMTII